MSKFIAQFFTNLLEALVTSKTRIKLLLKFFLNSNSTSYLRSLAAEFGESSNSIRVELNRFEKAELLVSYNQGNRKYFQANLSHPIYPDIHNIVLKYIGIDHIIDNVIYKAGNLEKVFLTGDYAEGRDSGIIDLIFVGENLNTPYFLKLVGRAENAIKKKIRYVVMSKEEYIKNNKRIENSQILLWNQVDK